MPDKKTLGLARRKLGEYLLPLLSNQAHGWPYDKALLYRARAMYDLLLLMPTLTTAFPTLGSTFDYMPIAHFRLDKHIETIVNDMKAAGVPRVHMKNPIPRATPGEDAEYDAYAIRFYTEHKTRFLNCLPVIEACKILRFTYSMPEETLGQFAWTLEWCARTMMSCITKQDKETAQRALQFYVHALVIKQLCSVGDQDWSSPATGYVLFGSLTKYMQSETAALNISYQNKPWVPPRYTQIRPNVSVKIEPNICWHQKDDFINELDDTAADAQDIMAKTANEDSAKVCRDIMTACEKIKRNSI